MKVNIKFGYECRMLLDRIERTLTATGFDMNRIRREPSTFCKDDTCILKGLSEAILSNRAVWSSVQPHLNTFARELYVYDISKVANLSNSDLDELYTNRLKPLRIRSQRLRKRLEEIRDNAKAFQDFAQKHGAIRNFILSYLSDGRIEQLRNQFIGKYAGLKLNGVGVAICSEFFNNIGIDEFKGDSNTTRFFIRTGLAERSASPHDIRAMGVSIAKNSGRPRAFVDSLIWCFCAEDEGEICTKNNPKCHLCRLNTEEPRLCAYCGNATVPGKASLSHNDTKSTEQVELTGVNKVAQSSQTNSNSPEYEVEMNLPPSTGIIIEAQINDPSQYYLKTGIARGLLRLEISITELELGKVISAYRSHYGTLLNARSYSRSPRKNSAVAPIALVFGQEKYRAKLKKPEKSEGAWIPNGPVYDKSDSDVKLAGALCHAGFPVKQLASAQTNLRLPKPRPITLQSVQFEVTGERWTFLSQSGLTQSVGRPETDK